MIQPPLNLTTFYLQANANDLWPNLAKMTAYLLHSSLHSHSPSQYYAPIRRKVNKKMESIDNSHNIGDSLQQIEKRNWQHGLAITVTGRK
jgi:hypothetical protein